MQCGASPRVMSARRSAAPLLFAKRGGWRADLLVRSYGWAVLQHTLQMQNAGFAAYLRSVPIEYHLFAACGILLLLLGPRLVLLVPTAACFGWFLATVIGGAEVHREVSGYFLGFIADEFLLYAVFPALAVAVVLLCASRSRSASGPGGGPAFDAAIDENLCACCRILAVTALFFAALHKLNADFFDPAVSCMSLHGRLARWWDWPFTAAAARLGAPHIVLAEALVPLLLITVPAAGMLYTVLALQPFAHIGPTAFVAMVFTVALGFLQPGDDLVLRPFLRRAWPALALASGALLPLSWRAYRGELPWLPFYSFEVGSLWLAACLGALLWSALRARRGLVGCELLGSTRRGALRPFLVGVLAVSLVNGMTPYLGAKFRLSFAMLSNLRADRARWNHFLVPSWLHLQPYDAFVHVSAVSVTAADGRARPAPARFLRDGGQLTPGVFAPYAFARRVGGHRRAGDELDVALVYRGQPRRFDRALRDVAFGEFVASLPPGRLFQAKLSLEGPQPCVH